ncbi:Luminal-binding protein [Linum perenne]
MAKPKMSGGDVIGIDLGTTFSCVAVARDNKIEIIANDQGNRITPSFVAFAAANSERLIGEAARNQASTNPTRTIFDAKRLIGRDISFLPYPVVNRDGKPYVELTLKGGQLKSFSPQEISAMILGKMKETAESYIGRPVTGAVVTVPAYFNDAQRKATRDAGTIAGLNVLRIINEPTAGALAYGLNNLMKGRKRKILVYDLGGGTFDVSVLEIEDGVFEVLATGGDTHLGGGDFDRKLIKRKYKKDVSRESKALGRLRKECERAKRALSNQSQVTVEMDSFIDGNDFSEILSRARFEELNLDLFKKTLEVVERTMGDAKLKKSEIDEIVLVGGSTRIPRLREMLKEMFDGKEPSKGVNPDEAVAYGAAVLGASLSGSQSAALYDVTLCDVTPLSLGVEVVGGLMSVVIPRNTSIPTKLAGEYYTIEDQQTSVTIKVYQGERPLTKDCIELGRFVLSGITPAPRYEISSKLIFSVPITAKEKISSPSGKSSTHESLTITNYKGDLTKSEIERMIKEASKMVDEDKMAKARVDARNQLERYLYDIRNAMSNGVRDKMSWNEKRKVDSSVGEASNWLDENQSARKEDYEKRYKKLRDVWNPIITKVYGSSASSSSGS